jgi:hypothetical protein
MHSCVRCEAAFGGPSWSCPVCGFAPERRGYLRFAPEFATDDGFLEASFDHLEDVEEGSFWFRARNEVIGWAPAVALPDRHEPAGSWLRHRLCRDRPQSSTPTPPDRCRRSFDAGLQVARRSEFDVPRSIDRALERMMALELRLVRRGLSFPVADRCSRSPSADMILLPSVPAVAKSRGRNALVRVDCRHDEQSLEKAVEAVRYWSFTATC